MRFNWFLWGDIFFVISSIMFLIQPFFLVFVSNEKYHDHKDAKFFFLSKLLPINSCTRNQFYSDIISISISTLSFSEFHNANRFDSLSGRISAIPV